MKKLRKIFFETEMTWLRVIVFAVISAVVTAVILMLPFTKDTSFRQIGISFECWVVLALYVILNCRKPFEAGIKVFVYFLISQPLIYLIQVPFSSLGWGIFQYYPRWFYLTLACLPAGIIAWFIKKKNVLSALILAGGSTILALLGVYFVKRCIGAFPRYLISVLFCFVWAVLLIFICFETKRERIISCAVTLAVTFVFALFTLILPSAPEVSTSVDLGTGGDWYVSYQSGDDFCEVEFDDAVAVITAGKYGECEYEFSNDNDETLKVQVSYTKKDGLVTVSDK